MNYVLNTDTSCKYVNNCCQSVQSAYYNSNNIETDGLQDIGFTSSSPYIEHNPVISPFVDSNKVFDNANMHIDKVDFFCNDWNQDIILPHYYLIFLNGVNDPDRRGFYYDSLDTNNTMVLYACKEVPSGCLQVLCSEFMYIFHDTCTNFDFFIC